MRKGFKISVVAANMNEEHTIKKVLQGIPAFVDEVLVIDGHSQDNSPAIAKSLGYPVIPQEGKGRGNAFKTGFKHVTGDVIIMLSTDGNERSGDITKLVDTVIKGNDLVIASRFGQGKSFDVTPIRMFGNWFLTKCINLTGGTTLYDTQNGFRAVKKNALQKMNLEAEKFDIEAEITMKAGKLKLKIAEVPTIEDNREHGFSNLNTFRDGWKIFKRILKEAKRKPPYYETKKIPPQQSL